MSVEPIARLPSDLAARLDPIDAKLPDPGRLRHAAVLAILLPAADDTTRIVFIERSGQLRSHAGQLAFPGGKPEVGDATLVDTALREAEEEVALARRDANVIGRLGAVPTPTGFMIVPFVAWAPPGWEPVRASFEVHAILTPSIATLSDPTIHRITGGGVWDGYRYELHEFAIHQPPLWGATARMLWDLLERLRTR
jgi:8-oxo-dGTP pyrophosphatase MutT (NUDIX family)